jgi:hypothetical protein
VSSARAVLALALALPAAPAVDASRGAEGGHDGPAVAPGETGTARFVPALLEEFEVDAAMETVRLVDGAYRAPGNEGYDRALDRVAEELRAVGFGEREGLELEELHTPLASPAWTPRSARLEALLPGGEVVVLHAFAGPGERDRVMLPVNAPSAAVEGELVLEAEAVREGCVYAGEEPLTGRGVAAHARRGAAAVLSGWLSDLTRDPTGGDAHRDAIAFRSVSPGIALPVAQISPRSLARLRELAAQHEGLRVRLTADVELREGAVLRTLVARVVGATRPQEAVVIASHAQEPGAGDNASGVGGLCEGAVALVRSLREGSLDRPARSLVFVFGDEMRQSALFLEHTELEVVAAISADMLGQSRASTGARCLLERAPDPGALVTLPPDRHTPWGAGAVSEEDLVPAGVALVVRSALADVARAVGGWETGENPWEGGSDHDVFLDRGVPAVLVWHFTDWTYHTSLDRLDRLDAEELRRSAVAVVGAALGLADLRSADLPRLRASNALELELRVAAALEAARPDVARRWREWCRGVDLWFDARRVDPGTSNTGGAPRRTERRDDP